MKKFLLSFGLLFIFSGYVLYQRNPLFLFVDKDEVGLPIQSTNNITTNTNIQTNFIGQFTDGEYIGSSAPSYSEDIQVTAVISGERLTDIRFPVNSNGPRESRIRYSYAMPKLKIEAIQAQSANVNAISGASYTSQAFSRSLAYALQQAKK